MLDRIRFIINEWDPLEILPYAPDDEYDSEVIEIFEFLRKNKNVSVICLGNQIYAIFLRTLGEDVFNKSLKECVEVAQRILSQ